MAVTKQPRNGSQKVVFELVVREGDPPIWRVLAGSEPSPDAAEALATRIRQEQNLSAAFVVRLDP